MQVLKEPTRKGAILGLLFVNSEGLVVKVVIGGCLGHSDHKVVEFQIVGERSQTASKTSTLRVTEYWNRWHRGAVESPSLEIFNTHLDAVLCSLL